jgi:hypothetical protein
MKIAKLHLDIKLQCTTELIPRKVQYIPRAHELNMGEKVLLINQSDDVTLLKAI